jgi:hypothetical protein
MKTRAYLLTLAVVAGAVCASLAACDLNPQPLPPGEEPDAALPSNSGSGSGGGLGGGSNGSGGTTGTGSGSGGGSGSSGGGVPGVDAGPIAEDAAVPDGGTVPPGDAGADAPSDAPSDGHEDGAADATSE